ncbi:MAG: right-handed parallel beta-helix repeat-containing protein [Planctomycetota bacterium]
MLYALQSHSSRVASAAAACLLLATSAISQVVFQVPPPTGGDDAPNIQLQIDLARTHALSNAGSGPAIVEFMSGAQYRLVTYAFGGQEPFCLLLQNMSTNLDRLILRGNGATLVHARMDGISLGVRGSKRVTIEKLNFDRDPRPFMEGTVVATMGSEVDVKYLRGARPSQFPILSGQSPYWGWLLDPVVPGRPKAGSRTHYSIALSDVMPLGNDVYRMGLGSASLVADFQIGDRFTYHYREGGSNIQLRTSSDIVVQQVTSYASGSMLVNVGQCHLLTIRECNALIPPDHWRSLNGDGFYVQCSTGVTIEDNYLEGLSDDGINLTAVNGFSVLRNVFTDKRRHAILLDAPDPLTPGCLPNNSTNGLIRWNSASYCGTSFLAHDGGDYATVAILDNTPVFNNRTRGATLNRRVRLSVSSNPTLSIRATPGPNGLWDAGDSIFLDNAGDPEESQWQLQDRLTNDQHLFISRAARDAFTWLYFAKASAPSNVVRLGAPNASSNPPEQMWRIEEVTGPGVIRIRLDDGSSAPALYLSAASTGIPTVGTGIEVRPLNPADRNQVWLVDLVEDD